MGVIQRRFAGVTCERLVMPGARALPQWGRRTHVAGLRRRNRNSARALPSCSLRHHERTPGDQANDAARLEIISTLCLRVADGIGRRIGEIRVLLIAEKLCTSWLLYPSGLCLLVSARWRERAFTETILLDPAKSGQPCHNPLLLPVDGRVVQRHGESVAGCLCRGYIFLYFLCLRFGCCR